MSASVPRPRAFSARARAIVLATIGSAGLALGAAPSALALNTVSTTNGIAWGIHDAAAPGLDTGSIRSVTDNAFYGFGGLRMSVPTLVPGHPQAAFNGELMRGFGLEFDGIDRFTTTTPVTLGGVKVSRSIKIDSAGNYARFFDTFTNTTDNLLTIQVSFGGTAGLATGTATTSNQATVANTGSGDRTIGADDAWVTLASTPPGANPQASISSRGPSAVVLGTPATFGAGFGVGNFQRTAFSGPLPSTGLESNFFGYRQSITLAPGQTKSTLRFVVAGRTENSGSRPAGTQTATVDNAAQALALNPSLDGLTPAQVCTLANWDPAAIAAFNAAVCATVKTGEPTTKRYDEALPKTTVAYDVVGKTITELAADMASGKTTSQEITRAYLDRIAAYDVGQFGFHSFITVADDAMAQAKAADEKRAKGATGDLLGIPMAIKDLYDTKDMPTTDGTQALDGWRPRQDATQVAKLRAAGAVILGKTNLSEFANSGSYSESGYGMTWNAHKPSKTSLGSSGGSAVATALSFAGAAMGTQTGVSLFAPATGAGLVTLRGTDGISSGAGVMPLTWLQDFEGPIARSTSDVAIILNATTGTDPLDVATVHADADAKRPADWKTALDKDALKGKTIGYLESSFTGNYSYGQNDGTGEALKAKLAEFEALGATVKEMTGTLGPTGSTGTLTGNRGEEGWQRYWDLHADNPERPFSTAAGILSSPKNLSYNRGTTPARPRMTEEDVQKVLASRDVSKANWAAWLDANGVDAVVYPGFRSDVYDNDGAQTLSSDRASGYPTSNYGVPTLVLPVGTNPHGDPMTLQIVGRAFDDAKVLGFGYALEQHLGAAGKVLPQTAPALPYDATATPTEIEIEKPELPVTQAPKEAPTETSPVANPQPAAPQPVVSVTFPKQGKIKFGRAKVVVKNNGTAGTTGRVVITGKVKVSSGGKTRTVTRTLGTAKVTLAVGQQRTISVKLNANGRKAIRGKKSTSVTVGYEVYTAADASQKLKLRR